MTDKEIIKGYTEDEIMSMLKKGSGQLFNEDIIKLIEIKNDTINRQQAEIERLQKHSKKVLEICSRVTKANDERNNEIFQGAIEVVRAEAIKECLEKLKDYEPLLDLPWDIWKTFADAIDSFGKEMVGDDK